MIRVGLWWDPDDKTRWDAGQPKAGRVDAQVNVTSRCRAFRGAIGYIIPTDTKTHEAGPPSERQQGGTKRTVQQEIILDLPAEAQGLLADNGVELISALRDAGLNVKRGSFPAGVPFPEGGKEPVLTILAMGVTVPLVAAGIAKILDALGRNRKFLVTERTLAPVKTSDGRPLRCFGRRGAKQSIAAQVWVKRWCEFSGGKSLK